MGSPQEAEAEAEEAQEKASLKCSDANINAAKSLEETVTDCKPPSLPTMPCPKNLLCDTQFWRSFGDVEARNR